MDGKIVYSVMEDLDVTDGSDYLERIDDKGEKSLCRQYGITEDELDIIFIKWCEEC